MEARWFAGRLRELREAKAFSRDELAELAGIKPSAVRDIEQGVYSPNWETVVRLCRALAVTPDAFAQEPSPREPTGPGRPRRTTSAAHAPTTETPRTGRPASRRGGGKGKPRRT
jgi:transcriptional regulator with XRE-family HTH domain